MQQAVSFPEYHRGERAERCIHGIGLSVGPIAVVALIATTAPRADARSMVDVTLYGCGLMAMLACSVLYNLAPLLAARHCSAVSTTPPSSP